MSQHHSMQTKFMKKNEIRQFRAALREMVRELGMLSRKSSGTELSPLQSHILIELNTKPCGATELAAKLCVEKASMSRALRTLIEAGYLLREHDDLDGRASTFRLSDSGMQRLLSLEDAENGSPPPCCLGKISVATIRTIYF